MDEPTHALLSVADGLLEVFTAERDAPWTIAAAHPADPLGAGTAALLSAAAGATTRVVNPRGLGGSRPAEAAPTLAAMVDDLEAVRLALGLPPWIFWGMSGGGFIGQIYAQRRPEGLRALIVESAAPCFRASVDDPASLLSPRNPAWAGALAEAGLRPADADHDHDAAARWRSLAAERWVWCVDEVARLVVPGAVSTTMQRAMPEIWRFDARAGLGSIATPTLVIAGDVDPIAPIAHVRQVHEGIPGSRWVTIAGGGHVPVAEGRAEVREAVRALLAGLE
ncbi:MAG: alpha/beta hydrolase [Nannocystaceae bacterium]